MYFVTSKSDSVRTLKASFQQNLLHAATGRAQILESEITRKDVAVAKKDSHVAVVNFDVGVEL